MGLNNIEVKRINRNNLLRHMLETDVISKRSAATALHLSIPTVTQSLNDLVETGLVQEKGAMDSIGGRKSIGYSCIKNAKTAVGVDITRKHANIVILNLAMEILYSKRINIWLNDEPSSYDELRQMIETSIEDSGVQQDSILGIGYSFPGIVGGDGKTILAKHEQLKISYQLYDIVSKWFPYPAFLANDANCAGYAEAKVRTKEKNFVYFFVNPSVGGSLVIDGELFCGRTRRTGEFGHMTLVPGGRKCYCGRLGCVSAYCSTDILSNCTEGNLEMFFRKVEEKDEQCTAVWEEFMDYMAMAVHNMYNAFDMEIIIGGYIGQYMAPHMEALRARVQKRDPYLTDLSFIKASLLKYEASAIGAAGGFVEKYLKEI